MRTYYTLTEAGHYSFRGLNSILLPSPSPLLPIPRSEEVRTTHQFQDIFAFALAYGRRLFGVHRPRQERDDVLASELGAGGTAKPALEES